VFLVLGVLVVPLLLVVATTSYGDAPDAAAWVQMAFGVVAGQTIAIVTVVGVLVTAIVRRSGVGSIATFAIIAGVVTSLALSTISSQAAHLVRLLGS
jgi:hypothetical protein